MMLIEKCRTSKEIRNTLIEILQKAKDQKTLHDCVWKIAKAMKGNIDINMYPMLLEE